MVKNQAKKGLKRETEEESQKRRERNRKARERHFRKTGVSDSTIHWMKKGGWL